MGMKHFKLLIQEGAKKKKNYQTDRFLPDLSQGQDHLELFLRGCDVPGNASSAAVAKLILITYLIKMKDKIKFANIFESSVKRFYENL